ncbi:MULTISPECIES: hypothetical protein [Altererythrobacter]|uniref:hypothetical protein n=1 Tax=Altererythrobacter TaxID=361177 RepID=UPI000A6B464D|nr:MULTISPECIES: hypothetical protein [Altererythrobacter]MBO6610281.1 hypothetical protein [Altererythrobacter sp.]MBO6641898.1 hypothetical protein [Altererythrobacter sp.]MBO6709886.1 hypothetical protein [Altererythrobacter sp.]MBO6944299.1 hypothetical protein [Altererythrobacter sp.]
MSKQLAISSSFCTFALTAMVLFASPDQSSLHGSDPFMVVQAESTSLDLQVPSFFRD